MVVAGVVAVVFLVRTLFFGGEDKPDKARRAAQATPSTTSSHGTSPSEGSGRPLATLTPSPGSGGPPAPADDDNPASGNGRTDGSPADVLPASSTCADSALLVAVSTDQPTYHVGDQPVIRLTITNTSTAACRRDVGAAEQEVVISVDNDRIWSSDDCSPGGEPDERVIAAGETLHFAVTWPGLSSQPGCAGKHEVAGPGTYTLVGRLGALHSEPARLTLRS